jgi:preprotein translocase subunit SecA/nephrocystin-3
VFISSTFRDMQEEREELVKQIFPQLRRLCESHGVTWGEVDLRWGVPNEAKAEGKVLPLCLAEIEQALHLWRFETGILLPQTRHG